MMTVQQAPVYHNSNHAYQAHTTAPPQYWSAPQHHPQHHYYYAPQPYPYQQTPNMHYQAPSTQSAAVLPPYTAATQTPPPTPFFLCAPVNPPASVTPPPSAPSPEPVAAPEPEPVMSTACLSCVKSARGADGSKVNRTESENSEAVTRKSRPQPKCEEVGSSAVPKLENEQTNDFANMPKKTLRRQQLRLLLLRHAAKCDRSNGSCSVGTCAEMKKLSKHIATCRSGDKCTVKRCASSRFVLGHYMMCRKAGGSKHRNCPLCGPVRQAIEKSKTPSSSASSRKLEVITEEVFSSTDE